MWSSMAANHGQGLQHYSAWQVESTRAHGLGQLLFSAFLHTHQSDITEVSHSPEHHSMKKAYPVSSCSSLAKRWLSMASLPNTLC